jgi:hypothetical protein
MIASGSGYTTKNLQLKDGTLIPPGTPFKYTTDKIDRGRGKVTTTISGKHISLPLEAVSISDDAHPPASAVMSRFVPKRTTTGGDIFVCPVCSEEFRKEDDMQVHRLCDHPVAGDAQSGLCPIRTESSFFAKSPGLGPPPYQPFDPNIAPAIGRLGKNDLGRWRGIQGEHNSCYLDSLIFSLFLFTDKVDTVLSPPPSGGATEPFVERCRYHLRQHIVNELRTRIFVPAALIVQWRRMLSLVLPRQDLSEGATMCDMTETIDGILDYLGEPRFIEFESEAGAQRAYHLQLLVEERGRHALVQGALNYTLRSQKITITNHPKMLILFAPKHSATESAVKGFIPQPEILCNNRRYALVAVSCIKTSHYVTYALGRPPEKKDREFYFYDSMADRVEDIINVPVVRKVDLSPLLERPLRLPNILGNKECERLVKDAEVLYYTLLN